MEKIYMEDNNNRKTRRGVDFSVVLSFTVAIFAIFSIATYGIFSFQGTSVSYAAPLSDETQFTFNQAVVDGTSSIAYLNIGDSNDNISSGFTVPIFVAGTNTNYDNMVFCVEHNVSEPTLGTIVKKDGVIDDYGLLYILNKKLNTSVTGANQKYVEAFITQVSIWVYLYETKPNEVRSNVYGHYGLDGELLRPAEGQPNTGLYNDVYVNLITNTELEVIKNSFNLHLSGTPVPIYSGNNLYDAYIRPLVDEAKDVSVQKQFYITYNDQDKATITDDNKFYDSPLINVVGVPSGDLLSYDVSLEGIEGAFLVDENKQEMSSTGIAPGKSFYVRFPVEKAPTEGVIKNLTIHAVGHFDSLTGNYYMAENSGNANQKVITVTGTTKDVADDEVIPFTGSGDTGMNAAQTVYFIGLIILLCGVGIIYANAKPVEVKQQ